MSIINRMGSYEGPGVRIRAKKNDGTVRAWPCPRSRGYDRAASRRTCAGLPGVRRPGCPGLRTLGDRALAWRCRGPVPHRVSAVRREMALIPATTIGRKPPQVAPSSAREAGQVSRRIRCRALSEPYILIGQYVRLKIRATPRTPGT